MIASGKSARKRTLKIKFFRAFVESILPYNLETWTLTFTSETKLDGLFTKFLRRAFNIRLGDHFSNQELYGDIPEISSTIR